MYEVLAWKRGERVGGSRIILQRAVRLAMLMVLGISATLGGVAMLKDLTRSHWMHVPKSSGLLSCTIRQQLNALVMVDRSSVGETQMCEKLGLEPRRYEFRNQGNQAEGVALVNHQGEARRRENPRVRVDVRALLLASRRKEFL